MNEAETELRADPHTPANCPLGDKLVEQNITLAEISRSLTEGHSMMRQLSGSIDATTGLALRAEKTALSAHTEASNVRAEMQTHVTDFRSSVKTAGVFLVIILGILGVIFNQMNTDVRKTTDIAHDMLVQMAKKDEQIVAVIREIQNLHTITNGKR